MVDYSLGAQITPFQAPNLLGMAAQAQQMRTNMLAQQRLQQDFETQNALRSLLQSGVNLSDPQSVNKIAGVGGLELALKVKEAQDQSAARAAQTEAYRLTGQSTKLDIKEKELGLINKEANNARGMLAQILALSETNPEQAKIAYRNLYAKIKEHTPSIADQFSPEFSPEAARNGIFTLEQLQQRYAPQKPELVDTGAGKAFRSPTDPYALIEPRVIPAAPMPAPSGGIPVGRAPAVPTAGAAPVVPTYGSLGGVMPAITADSQSGQSLPLSVVTARRKEEERQAEAAQEGAKTTARKTAELNVAAEDRRRGAEQVLKAISDPSLDRLIMGSTSGALERYGAEKVGDITGSSTSGMKKIGQLETIAGQITLDLLNGKLGAGISNSDVDLVKGTLAKIADPNTPADKRLAALKQLRNNLQSTASGKPIEIAGEKRSAKGGSQGAERVVQRTGVYNGRRVVQYSDGTTEYAD